MKTSPSAGATSVRRVTGTQEALYAEIDLELSWSESDLPQSERTKHVHGLHPYLGKFPPQLAEALIGRHCPEGGLVLDPFCGSGTTLVEAVGLGRDAVGCDVSAFNALLAREKTRVARRRRRSRPGSPRRSPARRPRSRGRPGRRCPPTSAEWYGEEARRELLAYRAAIEPGSAWSGLASLVLTRAARSARLVRHDALDGAREPVREPYWCHKHRRTCLPTAGALRFLRRYSGDVAARVAAFAALRPAGARRERPAPRRARPAPRAAGRRARHLAALRRRDRLPRPARLRLRAARPARRARDEEIGSRSRGAGARAVRAYADDMVAALATAAACLRPGAPLAIVVNDRLGLYGDILERAGLRLESRTLRHVNRRTSRRAGEYFEEILVARRPFRRRGPRGARAPRSRAGGSRTAARSRRRS